MSSYFAFASLKSYLFDVLVWAIIGTIVLIISLALFKRTRLFVTTFGILLLVSSIPLAAMSEISINGCCGASSTGFEGLGYLIGAGVAMLGIVLIIFGKKLAKQRSTK